jgi:hypothetical protein
MALQKGTAEGLGRLLVEAFFFPGSMLIEPDTMAAKAYFRPLPLPQGGSHPTLFVVGPWPGVRATNAAVSIPTS